MNTAIMAKVTTAVKDIKKVITVMATAAATVTAEKEKVQEENAKIQEFRLTRSEEHTSELQSR